MDAGLSVALPRMSFSSDYYSQKDENNNDLEVDALSDNQRVEEKVDVVLRSELVQNVLNSNNIDEITDLYQQTLTALYLCENDNQSKGQIIARHQAEGEEKDLLIESLGSTIHASNARIQTLTECRDVLRGRIETLTCEVQSCAQENTLLRTRVEVLERVSASNARDKIHIQERITQQFNTTMQTMQHEIEELHVIRQNWFLKIMHKLFFPLDIYNSLDSLMINPHPWIISNEERRQGVRNFFEEKINKLNSYTMSHHFTLHLPQGVQVDNQVYYNVESILEAYRIKTEDCSVLFSSEEHITFQTVCCDIDWLISLGFDSLNPTEGDASRWQGSLGGERRHIYHIYPKST